MKISVAPPLHGEVSKTCKKNTGTKADNHISGMKANTSTNHVPTHFQHEGRHIPNLNKEF